MTALYEDILPNGYYYGPANDDDYSRSPDYGNEGSWQNIDDKARSEYLHKGVYFGSPDYANMLWTWSDMVNPLAIIDYITVVVDCEGTLALDRCDLAIWRDGAFHTTDYLGASLGGMNGITLDPFSQDWLVNPLDGSAWTQEAIDALIVGCQFGGTYPFSGTHLYSMYIRVNFVGFTALDKRVGSIRHMYRPGVYKMEVTLGGLVQGIDSPLGFGSPSILGNDPASIQDQIPSGQVNRTELMKQLTAISQRNATEIVEAVKSDNPIQYTPNLYTQAWDFVNKTVVQPTLQFFKPVADFWTGLFK